MVVVCLVVLLQIGPRNVYAQSDPGPRTGTAGAGGAYSALGAGEQAMFTQAMQAFMEVDSVSGGIEGEDGTGLGPGFNGNSCAQCHAQPAMGGSSPGSKSPQNPMPNPQVALATLHGAANKVPPFITPDGPVREARFIMTVTQQGSVPDGGVHDLFSVTGRSDAAGCTMATTRVREGAGPQQRNLPDPHARIWIGAGGSRLRTAYCERTWRRMLLRKLFWEFAEVLTRAAMMERLRDSDGRHKTSRC